MKPLEFTHPGILLKEVIDDMGLTAYRVCKETGISNANLGKILKGMRSITPDTALRLAKFFDVSENYFINLQRHYDVEKAKKLNTREYQQIRQYAA